jgi:hypothetical protein
VFITIYTSNIVQAETNLEVTAVVEKSFPQQTVFDAIIVGDSSVNRIVADLSRSD